jgi:geranylgeranyl reductase family protein
MRREADVAIVGAGPSGSRCAELLADAGHDVLLIEKDKFAGETNVCGGVLDASFVSEIDLPPSMSKQIDRWICHFEARVTELETRKISFARNRFDRHLAWRAVSRGAELFTSTRAISAARDGRGISIVTMNTKSGQREAVRTRLAIFADGPSTIAQPFFGTGYHSNPRNIAVGAIYELEHDGSGESYELFFDSMISPWGYAWIVPKPDHLNVGVMCSAAKMTRRIKEYLDYFVHKNPATCYRLERIKKLRFAAAPIPLAPAKVLSSDRVLVVGDAAGMADAIWGGGIKYALRGAECAASVASEALAQQRYDACFLAQYDLLWKRTPDYSVLRKSKLLSDVTLPLQKVCPDIYSRVVSFGISHPRVQRVLNMEARLKRA